MTINLAPNTTLNHFTFIYKKIRYLYVNGTLVYEYFIARIILSSCVNNIYHYSQLFIIYYLWQHGDLRSES